MGEHSWTHMQSPSGSRESLLVEADTLLGHWRQRMPLLVHLLQQHEAPISKVTCEQWPNDAVSPMGMIGGVPVGMMGAAMPGQGAPPLRHDERCHQGDAGHGPPQVRRKADDIRAMA